MYIFPSYYSFTRIVRYVDLSHMHINCSLGTPTHYHHKAGEMLLTSLASTPCHFLSLSLKGKDPPYSLFFKGIIPLKFPQVNPIIPTSFHLPPHSTTTINWPLSPTHFLALTAIISSLIPFCLAWQGPIIGLSGTIYLLFTLVLVSVEGYQGQCKLSMPEWQLFKKEDNWSAQTIAGNFKWDRTVTSGLKGDQHHCTGQSGKVSRVGPLIGQSGHMTSLTNELSENVKHTQILYIYRGINLLAPHLPETTWFAAKGTSFRSIEQDTGHNTRMYGKPTMRYHIMKEGTMATGGPSAGYLYQPSTYYP